MRVASNDIELDVAVAGYGYPVVLLHGFPELAYSWRYQLPALAEAGFRAIAPDLRGYGRSDKPEEVEAYGLATLVGDILGLLDSLDVERAAVVGHDWGSVVAWEMARSHPQRVSRVVSLNVPYKGYPGGFPSTAVIEERLADRYWYVLFFQELGRAEAWFEEDLAGRLGAFYYGAAADAAFLGNDDFEVYRQAFAEGGLAGPINYYRNIDANVAAYQDAVGSPVEVPAMMVVADSDPVLPVSIVEGMESYVPDLRMEHVGDCGHWTQQEQPDRVNELLVDFLGE